MRLWYIDLQKKTRFSSLTAHLWDLTTSYVTYFLVYCVLPDTDPNKLSNNFHICSWWQAADTILSSCNDWPCDWTLRSEKEDLMGVVSRPCYTADGSLCAIPLSAEGSMKG